MGGGYLLPEKAENIRSGESSKEIALGKKKSKNRTQEENDGKRMVTKQSKKVKRIITRTTNLTIKRRYQKRAGIGGRKKEFEKLTAKLEEIKKLKKPKYAKSGSEKFLIG